MPYFNIVAATSENTVVTEYEPVTARSDSYQSEAALEKEFIRLLCEQGYTYLSIHCEDDLIRNLRAELERLNQYQFSDDEWERFFKESIANANEHIEEKTRKIQEDNVQVLKRDDGSTKNITLIDRKNIHNNSLQVINQYEVSQDEGARHNNRYDVTVLVNGLPLVHIELKRRGIPIREAFNQINRYQRDSFWAGCGLYEYIQIFVISNGTNTKYYSNSTRFNAIKDSKSRSGQKEKTSNSFEFTSYWADANNKVIPDLIDFTKTFFAKHTILNILTKYCVFTAEKMLMVMRPYQITATERILNRIEISNNYKKYGTIAGGGFIWHTTGSGKTLTSFKAARLASQLSYIDKVLFVVDRKDLDYQTMKEYDRFEKGAANSNTSSAILERQLRDPNAKIIITTIQKLSAFIKKFKTHEAYNQHVVIIFDESQHSGAESYRRLMAYFQPDFWLGMTATPETNRFDVYEIFDHNIAYEIRLKQALEEDLLCPFHYFGITDIEIDGEVIGDEDDAENFRAFGRLTCDERVDYVISQAEYYGHCGDRVKGLIFCSRKEEAKELSRKFNERGYRTEALTGEDSIAKREDAIARLVKDVGEVENNRRHQKENHETSRRNIGNLKDRRREKATNILERLDGRIENITENHENNQTNHPKVVSLDTVNPGTMGRDAVNPDIMSPATVNSNSMNRDASRLESTESLGFSETEEIQEDYLDYLITVDVFSEGVDIPEVNQVIMLRPTQSAIVFVQQLGRGLRKSRGKEFVVVLDFIGNYKKNFLIPIALSGDRSYNKDNIRRYVMEGDRVIPGISTIHFDEISRKRIFAAIDSSNFNDVRLIRENYTNLKFKLGRIPKLKDFDDYSEMDVCRIFDNASLGSYYEFLVKYEKEYHVRLSAAEKKMVEFISKKLASGKRIQELELLKRLLVYKHGIFHDLRKSLRENYDISMDENADDNLVNMMTNEFPTSAAKKTYETCIFIRKEGADYGISPSFEKMLENPDFYDIVKELIDFGISRYQANFSERYQNTDFVLYQKYTYEDVCRLLNWESNEVPLNIGGYKFDRKTRHCRYLLTTIRLKTSAIRRSTKTILWTPAR